MRRLSRYVGRTVFGAILLVLVLLLGLQVLGAAIDQSQDVTGRYTATEALIFVLLSVPAALPEFLPFACLIGCLVGLGLLASSSELTVMRAAGVSIGRIVWLVMRPVLLLMLMGFLVGEYIAPQATVYAEVRRAVLLSETGAISSRSGVWHREGNEFIHVNAVQSSGMLYGVSVYHFDEGQRLTSMLVAKRAVRDGEGWRLEGVRESIVGADRVATRQQETRFWPVSVSPEMLNMLAVKPENMSLARLWSYLDYRQRQGLSNAEYWLAFWSKALSPLSTIALVVVAISFVFGPLRQVTMGFRIFSGVLVGIAFRMAQSLIGPSSLVFGFSPLLATLLPILACLAAGWVMLRRVR